MKVFKDNEVNLLINEYKASNVISFPTDTVYGIGANLFDEAAINKIYRSKHRPNNKPLAVLCADIDQIKRVARTIPDDVMKLIMEFMPGALTVILPKKDIVPGYVTSNLDTVGVRIPNHKVALELLRNIGPLATTSANLSGNVALNDMNDVILELGEDIDLIIEGKTDIGVPSTVVALENGVVSVIREGIIKRVDIEKVIKEA